MTVLRAGSATDPGRVRSVNQDALLTTPTLFVVADGMGGHAAGDVASTMAIDALRGASERIGTMDALLAAVKAANEAIYHASVQDPSLAGMGTTVVAACLLAGPTGDQLVVLNVGDSRAYRFREGQVSQLTEDHSLAAEMIRTGELTEAEAAIHPQRHVITRALGVDGDVRPDAFPVALRQGDRLLLCSDGLTNEVDDEEVARVLATEADPAAAARDLVDRANAHGGADNISVVVVDVVVADEGASEREEDTGAHRMVATTVAASQRLQPSTTPRPTATTSAPADEGWLARRRRLGVRRAFTARVVLFALLVVGVLVGAWAFVRWYATSTYYVTTEHQAIVIYQGRPGGVLWFQPQLVTVSSTSLSEVLPSRRATLRGDVPEPSLTAAERYIANLAAEYQSIQAPQQSSAAPTTTTTMPSAVVTTPATTTTAAG
jgi:protein phosphatase